MCNTSRDIIRYFPQLPVKTLYLHYLAQVKLFITELYHIPVLIYDNCIAGWNVIYISYIYINFYYLWMFIYISGLFLIACKIYDIPNKGAPWNNVPNINQEQFYIIHAKLSTNAIKMSPTNTTFIYSNKLIGYQLYMKGTRQKIKCRGTKQVLNLIEKNGERNIDGLSSASGRLPS